MPGSVTVPSTLKGHAADIWRTTFLSAYDGTCAKRKQRDACAAQIAWASVKNKYQKGKNGQWVAKATDPVTGTVSPIPDPQGVGPSLGIAPNIGPQGQTGGPKSARWKAAYKKALSGECRDAQNPTECARAAANRDTANLKERGMDQFDDYPAAYSERKFYNAQQRREMAKSGEAMKDGSFPIADCEDVTNALRSLGRTKHSRESVLAHIRSRAESLSCKKTDALKTKMAMLDGYIDRMAVRAEGNRNDFALIEGYGETPIIRPDKISNMTWNRLPPSQKTVRAEATRRIIERNYAQAVEDAQIDGWRAEINHYKPEEYIFKRFIESDTGPVMIRSVLVRAPNEIAWHLRTVTTFASGTVARRLGDQEVRHIRENDFIIPVIHPAPKPVANPEQS
jgi:cation transport regulator ChaB